LAISKIILKKRKKMLNKNFILILSILNFVNIYTIFAGEWTDITYPLPLNHSLLTISTVSSEVGWIGGSNGLILITTNGGVSWINVGNKYPIDSIHIGMCFAFNENKSFALGVLGSNTYLFRTEDGGNNWITLIHQPGGYFDNIGFKDSVNGILIGDPVGGRWSIWKTSDGGLNWDSTGLFLIQDGFDNSFFRDIVINGDSIWFGTTNNRVYYSYDFGNNWIYSNAGCDYTETISVNGNVGFAGKGGIGFGCVLKTTNGGINWSQFNLLPDQFLMYITHLNNGFWYSSGNKIYCSYDNGNNFFLQHSAPYFHGYWQIDIKKANNEIFGWAVTNKGLISKYHEIIGIKNISLEVPDKFKLYQNYPNPFNPITKIKFEVPLYNYKYKNDLNVQLRLYDVLGKEIVILVNEKLNPGTYEVQWDASHYSSGVYICKIKAGNYQDVKKMILIK
jgi:photosystem II stability/assembly factor-like uncharacterized protein